MPATIGSAFQSYRRSTPQGPVAMQIRDTAGQETYRALAPMYYRSADVALLVYDAKTAESRGKMADLHGNAVTQIIIVGNRINVSDDQTVSQELGGGLAQDHGVKPYLEVSAKTGQEIVGLFTEAATLRAIPTPAPPPEPESGCCWRGGPKCEPSTRGRTRFAFSQLFAQAVQECNDPL
jgi:GTPase SAR1 family protein